MSIWNIIVAQLCFSQDGVSVSWMFMTCVFVVLWVKLALTRKTQPRA